MRIKDANGRLTNDRDVQIISDNAAISVNVASNGQVVIGYNETFDNATYDDKYELANDAILNHITDKNNPHQNVGFYIEEYVKTPATGQIIYETSIPQSLYHVYDLALVETHVFPSLAESATLSVDIYRNDVSIFASNKINSIDGYTSSNGHYYNCDVGEFASTNWYKSTPQSFGPGDYIKVVVDSAYLIDRMLFRMIFW
jgi:hypothetical protein